MKNNNNNDIKNKKSLEINDSNVASNNNEETKKTFFEKLLSFFKKDKKISYVEVKQNIFNRIIRKIYIFFYYIYRKIIDNLKIFNEKYKKSIRFFWFIYSICILGYIWYFLLNDFKIFYDTKESLKLLCHVKTNSKSKFLFDLIYNNEIKNLENSLNFEILNKKINSLTLILKKILNYVFIFEKRFLFDWVYYQLYYLGAFLRDLTELIKMDAENYYINATAATKHAFEDPDVRIHEAYMSYPILHCAFIIIFGIHFIMLLIPLLCFWMWTLSLYLFLFFTPETLNKNPLRYLFYKYIQWYDVQKFIDLCYGVRNEILDSYIYPMLDAVFIVWPLEIRQLFSEIMPAFGSMPSVTLFSFMLLQFLFLLFMFIFIFYFLGYVFFSITVIPWVAYNRLSIKSSEFFIPRWEFMTRAERFFTLEEFVHEYECTILVPILNGLPANFHMHCKKKIRNSFNYIRKLNNKILKNFHFLYKIIIYFFVYKILKKYINLLKHYWNIGTKNSLTPSKLPRNIEVHFLHKILLTFLFMVRFGGKYVIFFLFLFFIFEFNFNFSASFIFYFKTKQFYDTIVSMFPQYISFCEIHTMLEREGQDGPLLLNLEKMRLKYNHDIFLNFMSDVIHLRFDFFYGTDNYVILFTFLICTYLDTLILLYGGFRKFLAIRISLYFFPLFKGGLFTGISIALDYIFSLVTKMPLQEAAPIFNFYDIFSYQYHFNVVKLPIVVQYSEDVGHHELARCSRTESRIFVEHMFDEEIKIPACFDVDRIEGFNSTVNEPRSKFSEYGEIPIKRRLAAELDPYSEFAENDLQYFNRSLEKGHPNYKPFKTTVSLCQIQNEFEQKQIATIKNNIMFFFDFRIIFSIFLILCSFLAILVPILICVAYLTLFERKVIGHMQRRTGPITVGLLGILQPIADGVKLFLKETIVPSHSNKIIYILAPLITFSLSLLSWMVIPFDTLYTIFNINLSVLFILAISSLSVYGIILAGWSSNSKYAFLGSIRSSAQMISYEISISLILLTLFITNFSLNFIDLINNQEFLWNCFIHFPMFFLFLISILAETNRHPFDLPEAEAELVSGYNVEYSAMTFALFFLGEYANIILMSVLTSIFFLGGWFFFSNISFLFLSFKSLLIMFFFIWCRAAFPRYRYDQLMFLGWKILLPIAISWILITLGFLFLLDNLMLFNN